MQTKSVISSAGRMVKAFEMLMLPMTWNIEVEDLGENKDEGAGDDLIEAEADEGFEPSPEQPVHLRHDEPGNEDGADQHADGGGDIAIGDDGKGRCLHRRQNHGNQQIGQVFQDVEAARRRAELLLGVGDGVGDLLRLVGLDLVGEIQALFGDEVAEAVAGAGDGRRVIGQHPEAERDHQDQVGELGEVKAAAMSLRSGQGGLDAEPDNQDHRQATEDVESRGLEYRCPAMRAIG